MNKKILDDKTNLCLWQLPNVTSSCLNNAVIFTCDVILHYVTLMTSEQELSDSSSASSPDSRC